MSKTLDRISSEQLHQTFVPLADSSFVGGKLQLDETVTCVSGTLTGTATYELRLAPAGTADGRMCSFMLNVSEDTELSITFDGQSVFQGVTDNSIYAVVYCDGLMWHKVWDRNVMVDISERLAALEALFTVPSGGNADEVLAKASGDDGDFEWQAIPKIPAGGTTGQVLAKKSETDFDLEWVTT